MMRLLRYVFLLAVGLIAGGRLRRERRRGATASAEPSRVRSDGSSWKRRLVTVGAFLALAGVVGALVLVTGVVSIKASSGHWAITRAVLNFASQRSVATYSLGIQAPPLDDPAMVLRGAGHYETACRPCHGGPDLRRPRVMAEMTPEPPYLPDVLGEWEPRQLFFIVKHGIKFSGMPAWPSQVRDDEVWSMVAFLLELPGLTEAEYQRLARGEAADESRPDAPARDLLGPVDVPGAVATSCARCHGADGLGRGVGAFPRLAGQRPQYLYAALRAYARGERHSGIMQPIAAGLDPAEMRTLAQYYARQDGPSLAEVDTVSRVTIERGEAIAHLGIPGRGIPSCADCHGPENALANPHYPELAGQYADYIVQQLELFKAGHRGGSPYAHIMHEVADRLTTEQMRDVALYYASLGAE